MLVNDSYLLCWIVSVIKMKNICLLFSFVFVTSADEGSKQKRSALNTQYYQIVPKIDRQIWASYEVKEPNSKLDAIPTTTVYLQWIFHWNVIQMAISSKILLRLRKLYTLTIVDFFVGQPLFHLNHGWASAAIVLFFVMNFFSYPFFTSMNKWWPSWLWRVA